MGNRVGRILVQINPWNIDVIRRRLNTHRWLRTMVIVLFQQFLSHTGQIHKEVMDLMSSQIKHKLELDDPQVQSSKIKGMLNLWVKQLSCVINRTVARNIMAGKAALVDAVNASSKDDRTSTQRDDQLAANSTAAHNFIEDLDLSLINQDHRQH